MFQLLKLTLSLLPWIPAVLCKVTTDEEFAVLEGRSLTISCHYEPQYASYVKYWCHGGTREFCTTLARTDDPRMTKEKVSIFDDPVQQLFTVTMKDLKKEDSGWYMCGVEIGSMWKADDVTFTNIKVIDGMSVVNNRMSGEVGSSVTVECLYSERYRESEKKWCRSGDWRSCLSTGSVGSYEDSSVAIRDDRSRAFTVTFKRLQVIDTAWYWCSAGQQKIAVHVLVTSQPTTTVISRLLPSQPVAYQPGRYLTEFSNKLRKDTFLMLVTLCPIASLIIIMAVVMTAIRTLKKNERNPSSSEVQRMNAKFIGHPKENASVIFFHKDSHDEY